MNVSVRILEYEIHPAANIFPMLEEKRLQELADDIRENGQREAIRLLNGKILDGRNRYAACKRLGIYPATEALPADLNPWAFVWSLNGQRRDLTTDQRYIIWKECAAEDAAWQKEQKRIRDEANRKRAEAAKGNDNAAKERTPQNSENTSSISTVLDDTTKNGDAPEEKPPKTSAQRKKADASNTNAGTVARVDFLEKNHPDLYGKVKTGEMTSSKAYNQAKKEERAKEIEAQREAIKNGEAKLPSGVFEVVVMDPPWNYGREYDPEGSRVANPYPEMTQGELLSMTPPFAEDSVLFLWTTHQFIWDAKALMDEWGFEYKGIITWDKKKIGMGHWIRMQCEFCLLGIKGKPIWQNTTWRDIIEEPRREHSRKPETFYEMVEVVTVGRRLDFFSRGERQGWEAFGNDTAKF
jgi:N6-adenosine-specific RNA methylase IME4